MAQQVGSLVWDGEYLESLLTLSKAERAKLGAQAAAAAARVASARDDEPGAVEAVRDFLRLPVPAADGLTTPSFLARLRAWGAQARREADAVVLFGIGGSYLGAKVLTDVHCGAYWNAERRNRDGYPELYFAGYTADPQPLAELQRHLAWRAEANPDYRIWAVLVSKSGTTAEPQAAWLYLREQWERLGIHYRVFTVTDAGNEELIPYAEAAEHFTIPATVGGRYSVFTAAGLLPAALVGADIDAFLAGAAEVAADLGATVAANAPLAAALWKYAAWQKGIRVEICMPYAQALAGVADWYAQLLAESLGKKFDRAGREIYYGRTPVCAVGTRDMHSMTQEHQEGGYHKLLQFITTAARTEDIRVPAHEAASIWSGHSFGEMTAAAQWANEKALALAGRYSCRLTVPEVSMKTVGALMYFFCMAIIYEAELANVNAFDQPGVEVYKALMRTEVGI